jgi:hypothetical protein
MTSVRLAALPQGQLIKTAEFLRAARRRYSNVSTDSGRSQRRGHQHGVVPIREGRGGGTQRHGVRQCRIGAVVIARARPLRTARRQVASSSQLQMARAPWRAPASRPADLPMPWPPRSRHAAGAAAGTCEPQRSIERHRASRRHGSDLVERFEQRFDAQRLRNRSRPMRRSSSSCQW